MLVKTLSGGKRLTTFDIFKKRLHCNEYVPSKDHRSEIYFKNKNVKPDSILFLNYSLDSYVTRFRQQLF